MESDVQLYGGLAYIAVFIVLAYYFKKKPPKQINWIYGYRTRRSMANQEVWDAANAYWTSIFYRWQWYFLLFPLIVFLLFPDYNFIVTVIAHSLLIICTMPATEIYLDKNFDKNGNPK
ncbi:MAG: SdpI family protein [Marinirhabdus sp.]|nr:SdpI family protein [Marinirhabdus sp.]